MDKTVAAAVIAGTGLVMIVGITVMVWKAWRQCPTGKALIVQKMGTADRVTFGGGAIVLPIVNKAELIDISVITIDVACRGATCADESKVDLDVRFYVRINKTAEDVLKVAQSIGAARASDPRAIDELFRPKFTEAILTVVAHLQAAELNSRRMDLKDKIIEVIGKDLNGFILDDAAIDRIEPAKLVAHDPEGRGRVERDGGDELSRLRRDVDELREQVAKLQRAADRV